MRKAPVDLVICTVLYFSLSEAQMAIVCPSFVVFCRAPPAEKYTRGRALKAYRRLRVRNAQAGSSCSVLSASSWCSYACSAHVMLALFVLWRTHDLCNAGHSAHARHSPPLLSAKTRPSRACFTALKSSQVAYVFYSHLCFCFTALHYPNSCCQTLPFLAKQYRTFM